MAEPGDDDEVEALREWEAISIIGQLFREGPTALEHASAELRGDYFFMVSAVTSDVGALGGLRYVSEDLRANPDFLMEVLARCPGSAMTVLEYAAEELKNDPDFMMKMVSKAGHDEPVLQHASEALRADSAFMMEVLSRYRCWRALHDASDNLRCDRNFMMRAVSLSGGWNALAYASEELKTDEEILKTADWGTPPEGLVLRAMLLSGRDCALVVHKGARMETVLQKCALGLGLDEQRVMSQGVLLSGTATCLLHDLHAGRVNEVSLVLQS